MRRERETARRTIDRRSVSSSPPVRCSALTKDQRLRAAGHLTVERHGHHSTDISAHRRVAWSRPAPSTIEHAASA